MNEVTKEIIKWRIQEISKYIVDNNRYIQIYKKKLKEFEEKNMKYNDEIMQLQNDLRGV